MSEENPRFPGQRSKMFVRFNTRHFKGQNGHVNIVGVRKKVKVLNTSNRYRFLFMESQLLDHPVIVRLLNVCIPNFPVPHHLPRHDVLDSDKRGRESPG
jgi:hypothetical protein